MKQIAGFQIPLRDNSEPTGPELGEALTWIGLKDPALSVAVFCDSGAFSEADLQTYLSPAEVAAARLAVAADERRSFLARRAFQRRFVAGVTGWTGGPADLPLLHGRDSRPTCPSAPDLCLSFTSSGPVAMAGAARGGMRLGLDIERLRQVPDVLGLARRFFDKTEVAYLQALPTAEQSPAFQRMWTVKEACLKAIGTGAVYGLDAFTVSWTGETFAVNPPAAFAPAGRWSVEALPAPEGTIATLALCRGAG